MKRFKQFLNEGDTSAAYDMEKIIVSAAGGPKFSSRRIKNSEEIGEKIINSLNLVGVGSFPNNTYPASDRWNRHFPGGAKGSTLTPKTDLLIGNKRISLKTGNAQLMSGGVNEASATFSVAAEQSGTQIDDAVVLMEQHIGNLLPSTDLTKLGIKGNKSQLTKQGLFQDIDILRKADEAHHAFKSDMRRLFQDNSNFAQAFVFEAMTGFVKFGNSIATADYFLVTDFKGNAKIHHVTSADDPYVAKISGQVKPDVKFKSTQKTSSAHKTVKNPKGKTGFYTFWSAVGVGINMIVNESIDGMENELITENWLRGIINRIKNWVTSFFVKVRSQIGNSWEKLLEFATLEPEINFRNNVNW